MQKQSENYSSPTMWYLLGIDVINLHHVLMKLTFFLYFKDEIIEMQKDEIWTWDHISNELKTSGLIITKMAQINKVVTNRDRGEEVKTIISPIYSLQNGIYSMSITSLSGILHEDKKKLNSAAVGCLLACQHHFHSPLFAPLHNGDWRAENYIFILSCQKDS